MNTYTWVSTSFPHKHFYLHIGDPIFAFCFVLCVFLILAPPCTLYRLVIEILLTNGPARFSFCQGKLTWLGLFVLNVVISFGMIKYRSTQTGWQRCNSFFAQEFVVEREINILFCQMFFLYFYILNFFLFVSTLFSIIRIIILIFLRVFDRLQINEAI